MHHILSPTPGHPVFRRPRLAAAFAAALLACLPLPASAHTGLHRSVPADGDAVASAPEAIELEFHGEVRLIRVTPEQDGSEVSTTFAPAASASARYEIPVKGLRSGPVTVGWAAIGEDGHTVTGTFAFTVEPDGPEVASP